MLNFPTKLLIFWAFVRGDFQMMCTPHNWFVWRSESIMRMINYLFLQGACNIHNETLTLPSTEKKSSGYFAALSRCSQVQHTQFLAATIHGTVSPKVMWTPKSGLWASMWNNSEGPHVQIIHNSSWDWLRAHLQLSQGMISLSI